MTDISVNIQNATIIPSVDAVKEFAKQLLDELKADPAKDAAFKSFPREFLARRGLCHDLQNELLSDIGTVEAAGCMETCLCTGCCVTEIN
ncbi:hypothetical protein HV198_13800 [Citrobacter freundii]|uniref:Uncharacterized protein n=1 Tax=Citrobacter freundii TaxID=546 RepID=A0AAE7KYK9_CITFR|nr:hypothetical protein [Citrobacter freundii]QLO13633.1 hypothetical protein HV183_09390 [Citrobacter freundii]QLO43159.1 hypothetical protein HV215_13800 [Citrobacter freundii]QLV41323.1 hypothetical protein HV198_13800 [Citrobacter freundii]